MLNLCSQIRDTQYFNLKQSKLFIPYTFNAVLHYAHTHTEKSYLIINLILQLVIQQFKLAPTNDFRHEFKYSFIKIKDGVYKNVKRYATSIMWFCFPLHFRVYWNKLKINTVTQIMDRERLNSVNFSGNCQNMPLIVE